VNAADFDCEHCIWGRHCDDTNPAPFAKWILPGVIESRTCLLPMITGESHFLLRMYRHYKERILPFAGGILEQPHFYAMAMEIIADAESNAVTARDAQRSRR